MMHVACIADGSYWRHAGAMLHSLLSHNRDVTLHVLHGAGAPAAERERLRQVAAAFGAPLHFLQAPAGARSTSPHFPDSVWYRIYLPELLPQLDRILYLDCDLVVLGSLRELWDTDISGHVLAAVTNPLPRPLQDYPTAQLGLPPDAYFNSGVLLLNLQRLRRENARERLLEYARQHPDNACPDQDALNALFHTDRLALHPRWNFQVPLTDLKPEHTPLPAEQVQAAAAAPAIVHFSGPFKPWLHLGRDPWQERFREHARATPWPPLPPPRSTLASRVLRRLPTDWIWRYLVLRSRLLHRRP